MSGHKESGLVVALNLCESHPWTTRITLEGFSFNGVNFVNPVHESDKFQSASTFQWSSMRHSCNTSRFVCVLVTSMYFSGIGNDSSSGT